MGPAVALAAIGAGLILIGGVALWRGTADVRLIGGTLIVGGLLCAALALPAG